MSLLCESTEKAGQRDPTVKNPPITVADGWCIYFVNNIVSPPNQIVNLENSGQLACDFEKNIKNNLALGWFQRIVHDEFLTQFEVQNRVRYFSSIGNRIDIIISDPRPQILIKRND